MFFIFRLAPRPSRLTVVTVIMPGMMQALKGGGRQQPCPG